MAVAVDVAVDVFSPGSFCLSSFADSATIIVANAVIEPAVTAAVSVAANVAANAALPLPWDKFLLKKGF